MKKSATLFALLLFALTSFAATSKPVSYKSGDETVQGILYTPAGKGPFPALIVIHEWWGLNDWVKDQGSKLADEGYVALAIDRSPTSNLIVSAPSDGAWAEATRLM